LDGKKEYSDSADILTPVDFETPENIKMCL
jgi:hypothetical protein